MFSVRPPSTLPQNPLRLSGDDPTATSTQARPSSQVVPEPLPTSVNVGNLTFHTGEVKTPLSELEERILCFAFHPQTPKELGDIDEKNHLYAYAFGPNDYFSDRHLPWNLNLPEKMQVICALDPSLNRLNLRRVIITDLQNPQDIYCDASFALPITKETASPPGSTVRPAVSPPAPPEAASRDALLTARAQFSGAARGSASFAAAAPISRDPAPATRAKAKMRSATNDEISEQLWHPDGRVRIRVEIAAALHALDLGVDAARITKLLRQARGVVQRPSAPEELLWEELRDPNGKMRNRAEIIDAVHARNWGVSPGRIDKLLRQARGVEQRP